MKNALIRRDRRRQLQYLRQATTTTKTEGWLAQQGRTSRLKVELLAGIRLHSERSSEQRLKPLGFTTYLTRKTLTDERHIASLPPQGIQPGMFRQVIVGISGDR